MSIFLIDRKNNTFYSYSTERPNIAYSSRILRQFKFLTEICTINLAKMVLFATIPKIQICPGEQEFIPNFWNNIFISSLCFTTNMHM